MQKFNMIKNACFVFFPYFFSLIDFHTQMRARQTTFIFRRFSHANDCRKRYALLMILKSSHAYDCTNGGWGVELFYVNQTKPQTDFSCIHYRNTARLVSDEFSMHMVAGKEYVYFLADFPTRINIITGDGEKRIQVTFMSHTIWDLTVLFMYTPHFSESCLFDDFFSMQMSAKKNVCLFCDDFLCKRVQDNECIISYTMLKIASKEWFRMQNSRTERSLFHYYLNVYFAVFCIK